MLWEMIRKGSVPEGYVLHTGFQTAGKGQTGNAWESEPVKNLLFSMVLYPNRIRPDEQFLISQLVSVAIKKSLDEHTDDFTVKWPNDIYWKDKKIAGMLIENSLQGNQIKTTVIGIGLNVNQTCFVSDAPNPVSLRQIKGTRQLRSPLLASIKLNIMNLYKDLDAEKIRAEYAGMLYRREGFHSFRACNQTFQARIVTVHPDGQMELELENGERKGYYFKEVSFVVG